MVRELHAKAETMTTVRYRSPDDPAFVVFDKARFRIEHATFHLRFDPIRRALAAAIAEREGWNLAAMKLVEEDRRLRSCLEWLNKLPAAAEGPVSPDLVHEPAIDVVADTLIGAGEYDRAECPACDVAYAAAEIAREPWAFDEKGVSVRGRRSTCPRGHTLHALTDLIDDPGIEVPEIGGVPP